MFSLMLKNTFFLSFGIVTVELLIVFVKILSYFYVWKSFEFGGIWKFAVW